ncbi:MAG TPA: FKBP-type peptidyl-prolyl cis-trans isomerase [Verrucomicrobiae bacterium]|jgi:FKBP-type peptidyl-prolyl cis-trans isomerase|nr:FKBP-type peptidyl-prolyl cis-trans isomerase [Verrucomicrobiae bacterium]
MKIKNCSLLFLALSALPVLAQPMTSAMAPPPSTNAPAPDKHKLNVMIGSSLGRQLAQPEIKELLDFDVILSSMKAYVDGKPEMTDAELREVSREFGAYMNGKRQLKALEMKKQGEEFLAKNATADDVKSLSDGLQYKILKAGTGEHPKSNDVVTVKYKGTLIDGSEFDHNDSAKLSLANVVQGWKEGIPMMTVGSEWQLFIPPDIGYGKYGHPPKIPANSVLIFDIELLGTEAPPTPPAITGATPGNGNQIVSGEIIKVPSAEGLKKGEKIEVIKPGQTNVVEPK